MNQTITKQKDSPSVLKLFIRYVSLNVLGMIGLSCYILADTFFIANGVGADGLTALNLAIPIYSLLNAVGLMIGIGTAARYSILQAQGRHREADGIFSHAVYLAVFFAVLFTIAGVLFSGQMSGALGGDESTYEMTRVYLKTVLSFSLFFIMNNLIVCMVRNDGEPNLAMAAMLIGSFSNIVLDYLFVYPLQMGMLGAALATGASPVIGLCILSIHKWRKRNRFHFIKARLNWGIIGNIFALGAATFVGEISSGIVIIVFNMVILSLEGNTGVAAYGVIVNLALVALAVFTGIAQGTQPIISTSHGKGAQREVYRVTVYAIITAVIFAAGIYIVSVLAAEPMISVFNRDNDKVLAGLAHEGIWIYFIGFIFAGVNTITALLFSAVELPMRAFAISLLRGGVIIVPLVILMAKLGGMTGVWISYPLAEALTAAAALVFLLQYKRKHKGIVIEY